MLQEMTALLEDHINPNCKMKRIILEGRPRLCLFALRDITSGVEITYNYGDGDCPWRSKVTESGPEAGSSHLESETASEVDQRFTKHSQHRFSSEIQVTNSGTTTDSKGLEPDCASGDNHHGTQQSLQDSTFCKMVTNSGTTADVKRLEPDCASGDNHHGTQHLLQDSTFCKMVTNSGTTTDSKGLEQDCASGDNHHGTQQSLQDSTFCRMVTKRGTTADSKGLEPDCASGDNHHGTQQSLQDSTFCRMIGAELDIETSTKQAQETNQHQNQLATPESEPTSTTLVPKGVKVVKKRKWETNEVKAVEKHLNRCV
ncbi:uncharacterized protein [Hoplias malabaricus]|uniref:uncharacterized protein isoform X2 n=1 Tax=Hoplias malabaricus TaxID=27720 RepID=UPI00346315B0